MKNQDSERTVRRRKAAPVRDVRKRKNGKKRLLLYAVEAILLMVVLFFAYLYSLSRKIGYEEIKPEEISTNEVVPEVTEVMKGYRNIALFGVDSRDNTTIGKGTHADTNLICSINMDTGDIKLVSIYRDSYLNIKGDETFNKLTQAYFEGGATQSINTLNKNLDLNITEFVTVNWKAVADAINILGGIDIDITKSEFSQINGFITATHEATGVPTVHLKAPGPNHLDGIQAVAYARLRLMDTDYKRTERQRLVIELTLQKAKQADLLTLNELVNAVFPQVLTNLDQSDILGLAKNITSYHITESIGFPFDKDSKIMGKRGDCVIPLGLAQNVSQLHSFLFESEQYTPSPTVIRLDELLKKASGLGDPGTNPKPVPTTPKPTPSTTAAATEATTAATESAENEPAGTESTEAGTSADDGTSGDTAAQPAPDNSEAAVPSENPVSGVTEDIMGNQPEETLPSQ